MLSLFTIRRWSRRDPENGQVIVLLVFWLIVLTVFAAYIVNAGRVTNERLQAQHAVDAAAMSGGVWMARVMNVSALCAVTSTQVMANIALLRAIKPTAEACEKVAYGYIAAGKAIQAIPYVGPFIGIPIEAYGQAGKFYYKTLKKTEKAVDRLTKPPPQTGRGSKGAFWHIVRGMRITQQVMKYASLPLVEGATIFAALGNGAKMGFLIQMRGGIPMPPIAPLSTYGSKQYMRLYCNEFDLKSLDTNSLFDDGEFDGPEQHAYGLPGPGTADARMLGMWDGSATYRDGSSTTWGTIWHPSDFPKPTRQFFDHEVYEIIMTGALVFTPMVPHLIYIPFSMGLIEKWFPGEDAPDGGGYEFEDNDPIIIEVEEVTASYDELHDAHQKDPDCVIATFWSKTRVLTRRDPAHADELPREPFDFGEALEDVEKYDPDEPERVGFIDAWQDPDVDGQEAMSKTKNGWKPPPGDSIRFDTDPPPNPDPDEPEYPKQTHFRQHQRLSRSGRDAWNDVYNPAKDAMEHTDTYDSDHPLYFRRKRKFRVQGQQGLRADEKDGRPIFDPDAEFGRDRWEVVWLDAPGGASKEEKTLYRPSPLYEVTDWKFVQGRYRVEKEFEDDPTHDGDPDATFDEFTSEVEFGVDDIPWETLITQGPFAAAVKIAVNKIIEPLAEKLLVACLDKMGPIGELLKLGIESHDPGSGDEDDPNRDEQRRKDNFQKHAPLHFDPDKTGGSAVLQYTGFAFLEGQSFSMFGALFEKSRRGILGRVRLTYASVSVYNATFDSDEADGMEDCGHLTFAQAWHSRLSPLALQFKSDFKPEWVDPLRGTFEQFGITQLGPVFDLVDEFFDKLTQGAEFPLCMFTH